MQDSGAVALRLKGIKMSYNDLAKMKPAALKSIMDDVPPVPRSVSAAALLAARTGQPLPLDIRPVGTKK